jgi:hypothetical protein
VSTPAPPPPPVPYGPPPGTAPVAASNSITPDVVAKGVGATAVKWGIRILLPLLLRAIFRALSRR